MTSPKMMPGQEPYTEAELTKLAHMINWACVATEIYGDDELEEFAEAQREKKKMMLSLTYGELPNKHSFDLHYREYRQERNFPFGNDKRMGNATLTRDELWTELQKAVEEWRVLGVTSEGVARTWDGGDTQKEADAAGEWCSSVLFCLGIEWI